MFLRAAALIASLNAVAWAGFGQLPLNFEPNRGQTDSKVRFVARASGMQVFLLNDAIVLRPRGAAPVTLRFAGARAASIDGAERLPGITNYLIGNDASRWRRDIPHYAGARYSGLYPGIDLAVYGKERRLEYDLIVAPGADPDRAQLRIDGVRRLALAANGDLELHTASGVMTQQRPLAYQQRDGRRAPVDVRYRLLGANRVAFVLGAYDRGAELVIDPVLVYSTYLGGALDDRIAGLAVDESGAAYVVGESQSITFGFQLILGGAPRGGVDLFVAKLNPAGDSVAYLTFYGGAQNESAGGIAVGGDGSVFIAGTTQSNDLPGVNALQGSLGGASDALLARVSPDGRSLLFSTYLGGSKADGAYGVARDASGAAVIAGYTDSSDFPVSNAPYGPRGERDAFVAKVHVSGKPLIHSTYIGGAGLDEAHAVAVDASGAAIIAGHTDSSNFPTTQNALQGARRGDVDAFVARIAPFGGIVEYSTYLGGAADDVANGVAVDAWGAMYVTGSTRSANFPTARRIQEYKGEDDVFVTKLTHDGALEYSTFLGGALSEVGQAIAVDYTGAAAVTGRTVSEDYPTTFGLQFGLAGGPDAFVSKLTSRGDSLFFSTFYGGGQIDTGYGVALDRMGGVYVAGTTESPNFPLQGAVQNYAGGSEGFLLKARHRPARIGLFRYGMWLLDWNANGTWEGQELDRLHFIGQLSDTPLVGDWTGDGLAKIGFFREGMWLLDRDGNGQWNGPSTDGLHFLGRAFDTPLTGDWSGADRTAIGFYRASEGMFLLDYDGNGEWNGDTIDRLYFWGVAPGLPVTGDWTGDGKTKVGIFRDDRFELDMNGDGRPDRTILLGLAGDVPVVGDWNGDGRAKVGVFRNGRWILDFNGDGIIDNVSDRNFVFGISGDIPMVGDWSGTGRDLVGVFRSGFWMLDYNGNFRPDGPIQDREHRLGQPGDTPLAGRW